MTVIAFISGLIFGSFALAYADRYRSGTSVWRGRSACSHCHHRLHAVDLVPVVSFLLQRGRCRYCGRRLSWQYLTVELASGALLAGLWIWLDSAWNEPLDVVRALFFSYLAVVAIILTVIDVRQRLLPDRVVAPAALVTLAYLISQWLLGDLTLSGLATHLAVGGLAGGLFLGLVVVSKGRWMGGGDVKLFALAGLLLGWPDSVVALLISFWSAAFVSVALMAAGRKGWADEIPFGPFLLLGTITALVWGEAITSAYLRLIG